jgi:superfamily II DNA or RNA helicase
MVQEFRKPDSYIRGLVSVSALAKGFDVSDVGVIIMARPLKSSLAEHIQILGRGLRIHPGKSDCIVLDHAGNCRRFWADMQEFFACGASELDDGKPKPKAKEKPKEVEPMRCPKCACVHSPAPHCPSCGHVYTRPSTITHVNGTLSELSGGAASSDERRTFYAELLYIAHERGYSDGWCGHKYKEKYGAFPRGMRPDPIPASAKTRSWVRSRMIAWAKSRDKREAQRASV